MNEATGEGGFGFSSGETPNSKIDHKQGSRVLVRKKREPLLPEVMGVCNLGVEAETTEENREN